jgi:hypothetical protein
MRFEQSFRKGAPSQRAHQDVNKEDDLLVGRGNESQRSSASGKKLV